MKAKVFFHHASRLALAISLACSMALATYAGSDHKREAASANDGLAVDIENFGKINDHYYRGAQPKGRNYAQLATIGIKTIVDLREDAKGSARSEAERAG